MRRAAEQRLDVRHVPVRRLRAQHQVQGAGGVVQPGQSGLRLQEARVGLLGERRGDGPERSGLGHVAFDRREQVFRIGVGLPVPDERALRGVVGDTPAVPVGVAVRHGGVQQVVRLARRAGEAPLRPGLQILRDQLLLRGREDAGGGSIRHWSGAFAQLLRRAAEPYEVAVDHDGHRLTEVVGLLTRRQERLDVVGGHPVAVRGLREVRGCDDHVGPQIGRQPCEIHTREESVDVSAAQQQGVPAVRRPAHGGHVRRPEVAGENLFPGHSAHAPVGGVAVTAHGFDLNTHRGARQHTVRLMGPCGAPGGAPGERGSCHRRCHGREDFK